MDTEKVYEIVVTLLVAVRAKNEAHARKIVEGGVSTALNVKLVALDLETIDVAEPE